MKATKVVKFVREQVNWTSLLEPRAKKVPAAAVIREERGLFMMIGCKAGQGDKYKFYLYQKLHLRKNLKN